MKVILLGAGYATRLGELTKNKPKALLPIEEDKPIINYIVEKLEMIPDISEVIIISNSLFYTQFVEWAEKTKCNFPIKVLDDGTSSNETRLGAIGDIIFTLEKESIDDDIMILATDNLFTFELSDVYNFYKQAGTDVVVGKHFEDKGVIANRLACAVLDENNKILNIIEKPSVPPSNIGIFAIYLYQKSTVPLFSDYKKRGYLLDAPGNFLTYLYTQKPVHVYMMPGDILDVGTPESYEEAKELMKKLNN